MLRLVLALSLLSVLGCGPDNRGHSDGPVADGPKDGPPVKQDACVGLQCQVRPCEDMGRPTTTLSGTIFAPNGTLPLYGVTVYVPNKDPGPLPEGAQCAKCADRLPGDPVTSATTNEYGRFTVEDVPVGTDIPLVVQIGKWRRQLVVPTVNECTDNPVDPTLTRLPKNKTEGDIPKIALVTGGCDRLECLMRKLGVEDAEFTNDTNPGRIHMYQGTGGLTSGQGGQTFTSATTLWSSLDKLKQYDIGVFSCECGENPGTKPQASMNNIKAYADAGGRLFLSHYHHIWIVGNGAAQQPPVWPSVAQCTLDSTLTGDGIIDTMRNPKGLSFQLWMQQVMGSTSPGSFPITEGKQSCTSVDPTKAEQWVYVNKAGTQVPQNFQFTTPNEQPSNFRCGKVVFSDMHVSAGTATSPFPNGCNSAALTPQEKALAFMLFDIASCVGVIQ